MCKQFWQRCFYFLLKFMFLRKNGISEKKLKLISPSRRGHPKQIRCDNNASFVGAEKEIKEDLRYQQPQKIANNLTKTILNGTLTHCQVHGWGALWIPHKDYQKMPQGIFKRLQCNKRDTSQLLNGNRKYCV